MTPTELGEFVGSFIFAAVVFYLGYKDMKKRLKMSKEEKQRIHDTVYIPPVGETK